MIAMWGVVLALYAVGFLSFSLLVIVVLHRFEVRAERIARRAVALRKLAC